MQSFFFVVSLLLNVIFLIMFFFKSALNDMVKEWYLSKQKDKELGRHNDQKLLKSFIDLLPSNGDTINFLQSGNIEGCPFPLQFLDPLFSFTTQWDNAEYEFVDKKLESKRKEILRVIKEYLIFSGLNTFPVDKGRNTVPSEWAYKDPERFNTVVKKLYNLAGQAFILHQEIIRIGKKKNMIID